MNRHLKSVIVISLSVAVGMHTAGCSKVGDESRPETSAESDAQAKKGAAEVKPESPQGERTRPVVVIDTTMGVIKAELWDDETPETVKNFLQHVDASHYDDLVFHRVIPGFMIQGGGMTKDLRPKPTLPPIRNEASAELRNDRGTLAMARTNDPHSATSQFFINLVDNHALNHKEETPRGYGYCAFGKVIEGMSVVDEIAKVRTTTVGPHENVPAEPVVIKSIRKAD
jgi:peptidyl-prolyl cis-trans isomerase B (cyclophilin B)